MTLRFVNVCPCGRDELSTYQVHKWIEMVAL